MRERIKGKTLIASDEGDDASGVIIKLYGRRRTGSSRSSSSRSSRVFSYRHTCMRTMSGSTCSRGRCTLESARRSSRRHPGVGC